MSRLTCVRDRLGLAVLASMLGGSVDAIAQDAKPPSDETIKKLIKEHEERPDLAPGVGTVAPDFKLKRIDGKRDVELKSFRGKKPVVLVFGSYT